MTLARRLVRTVLACRETPVPDDVRDAARLHLLDAVGVGLAAAALEQGAPYRRLAPAQGKSCSTLAGGSTDDAAEAALIDGGLIHSLEYDDTHTASIVHGSAVFAATALGVGQSVDAAPERVLRAYLAGYEIAIRIGLAAPGAFQRRGFQITSVAGTLVAALIASELMDASEDERVNAIGIALSQSSGVFEFLTNGSSVKSMHPGWAAHSGVFAARLARAGLTGPETALEGQHGLYAMFAGDRQAAGRLSDLMADYSAHWHMREVAFKFYPCCHYLHPFLELAGQLAAQGVEVEMIERIDLAIAEGASAIVCEPWESKLAPQSGHAVRWSLPVTVAARLIDGRVDHETFRAPPAPPVLRLAGKMHWSPLSGDRFPQRFEAEIDCRLIDGRNIRLRADDVYGGASRPAARQDVLDKFRANAARRLTAPGVEAVEAFFTADRAQSFTPYRRAISMLKDGA